jgi:hypothetical protein
MFNIAFSPVLLGLETYCSLSSQSGLKSPLPGPLLLL